MRSCTDAEVMAVPAADAVALMAEALVARHEGRLESPVRFETALGQGAFVFTAGRMADAVSGFRVVNSVDEVRTEVTLVFDERGLPVGIVTGREVGRRRTGALGGVAANACARSDATTIGMIGAGNQAFTQLWAIASVRDLKLVRVFTRSSERRLAFAERVRAELGLAVEQVEDPQGAVTGSDIVVMSTPSTDPLIEAGWVEPGTHVHTLGRKGAFQGECPWALVEAVDVLVSDSPDQLNALLAPEQPWTRGRSVTPLGSVVAGTAPGRTSDADITLYASVGVGGTEVLLANHVLTRASR